MHEGHVTVPRTALADVLLRPTSFTSNPTLRRELSGYHDP